MSEAAVRSKVSVRKRGRERERRIEEMRDKREGT
jgi:hypothetical protein